MAEMAEHFRTLVETLVTRQQDWFEKLIASQEEQRSLAQRQQQEWMQQVLSQQKPQVNNDLPTGRLNVSVPAFRVFDHHKDRWDSYLECLNQHFEAHNVTSDEQRRAYFLSWVGSYVYDLLTKLFAGKDSPSKQSFSDLVQCLSKHFTSKTHVVAARYNFFTRKMQPDQDYASWVADLRGIARDCQFICGEDNCRKSFVDSLIRDAIIMHTPHDHVRTSALQHTNPTLEDVLKIAEAYEATQKTVQTIKGNEAAPVVHRVERQRSRSKDRKPSGEAGASLGKLKSCPDCGKEHLRSECKFRQAKCRRCSKVGHISSVCLSKPPASAGKAKAKKKSEDTSGKPVKVQQSCALSCQSVHQSDYEGSHKKIFVSIRVNGHEIKFQVDTGATCSMVDRCTYLELGNPQCSSTNQVLKAYGDTLIPLIGSMEVLAEYNEKRLKLPLLITDVPRGGNLLGLDWFRAFDFHVALNEVNLVSTSTQRSRVHDLCSKYSKVFEPGLGTCNVAKVSLHMKPDAKPKFFKPRQLPFSQLEAVNAEIKRLSDAGIWKSVPTSQWAAPIVVVPKPNGKVRICGDFKVTINPQIEVDQFPMPRPEELLQKLKCGSYFSRIDLADAYLQLELDDDAKKKLVVNTPQGLFEYQRLPFGVASAPAIFQRLLEQILQGLSGCANYLDDIIVTGRDDEEHFRNLEAVLKRLEQAGLKCNKGKCAFFETEVQYLGCVISSKGIRPTQAGTEAIRNLPRPKNIQELQSFLGKVNYYNKFIKGFSQVAEPLNELRRKGVRYVWKESQEAAFQEIKRRIIEATNLVHFDPRFQVILATDASSYGLGAVLSHRFPDGSEKPIAFASKTLNAQQRRYSAIEKEGLAIVYGVKKFHQYLYGRRFELVTDNKPLVSIFHPAKGVPTMTAQRLQRWAMLLMGYDYTIRYRRNEDHANADALSRLPSGPDESFDTQEDSCMQVLSEAEEDLASGPIDCKKVRAEVRKDPLLNRVLSFVRSGWPQHLSTSDMSLKPFFDRRLDLSVLNDTLVLLTDFPRVVIPSSLQEPTLQLLHEGHWGIVRTKQLARRYCWWPGIDKNIEDMIRRCDPCQQCQAMPHAEFSSWPESKQPWQRLHVDMAGPFWNSTWLVVTDAFSRFPFIVEMRSTKTTAIVDAIRRVLLVEGLPETIVTDNAPQFCSKEFQAFCSGIGVKHLTTPPFHPASNGAAERQVRTFKVAMKKAQYAGEKKLAALEKLLATYRATPNPTSGKSPAELLHGRQPRNLLSLLLPAPEAVAAEDSSTSSTARSQPVKGKTFALHEPVFVKNFAKGPTWLPGKIIKRIGKVLFLVETPQGNLRRHRNQLRERTPPLQQTSSDHSSLTVELVPILKKPGRKSTQHHPNRSVRFQEDCLRFRPGGMQ